MYEMFKDARQKEMEKHEQNRSGGQTSQGGKKITGEAVKDFVKNNPNLI